MRNQEGRTELQKKVHRRICVRNITFFGYMSSFLCHFCRFFRLLPPFRLVRFYIKKIFALENGGGEGRLVLPAPSVYSPASRAKDIISLHLIVIINRYLYWLLNLLEVKFDGISTKIIIATIQELRYKLLRSIKCSKEMEKWGIFVLLIRT